MERTRLQGLMQAYHDGELGWLGRWRARRAEARSAQARRELAQLAQVGEWVRDSQGEAPEPDLWAGIAQRLTAADSGQLAGADTTWDPPSISWDFGEWMGRLAWPSAAVGTAAAMAAVVFSLSGGEAALPVVGYLDAQDSVMVLTSEESDTTIIWVMESPPAAETSQREGRAFI